jgi:uncharacterized protein (TIGR02118 family)
MVKVSVLYPNTPDSTFDIDYFMNTHIPMMQSKLGAACKGVELEMGLAGVQPGEPPTYIAMGHLHFDSVGTFEAAFGPHAESLLADIPNYTNTQPVFQVSEVRI